MVAEAAAQEPRSLNQLAINTVYMILYDNVVYVYVVVVIVQDVVPYVFAHTE